MKIVFLSLFVSVQMVSSNVIGGQIPKVEHPDVSNIDGGTQKETLPLSARKESPPPRDCYDVMSHDSN